VLCVFNTTPLEKYESYRLYLERWAHESRTSLDMAPTVLNLADALLQFLKVDKYTTRAGEVGFNVVDRFPEVCFRQTEEGIAKVVLRKGGQRELSSVIRSLQEKGCCYVPRLNTFFVHKFEMLHMTEEIASFVHRACRGEIGTAESTSGDRSDHDTFYARVMEHAMRVFGSRVLYPSRPVLREADLYALYGGPQIDNGFGDDFENMIDFLVMHKDFEAHRSEYLRTPLLIEQGLASTGKKFEYLTRQLGELLGHQLYEGYLSGDLSKRTLRAMFFRDLGTAGEAQTVYFALARCCGKRSRRRVS
jgi:hypothetical protein